MRFVVLFVVLFGCRSDEGITKFNSLPEANIISHNDGDTIREGFPVTFLGSVFDANHEFDQLTATWYAGTEIICDEQVPLQDGATICETTLGVADTDITLVAKDIDNASGDAHVSLVITPTEAPTVQITSPTQAGIYYAEHLITFEGVVSDAEDEVAELQVEWQTNTDGLLDSVATTPTSEGVVVGYTTLPQGEYAIELHATDSTGKQNLDSVVITVGPPNSPPSCEITAPQQNAVGIAGEAVVFTGNANDVDVTADVLTAIWSSDKDGELGSAPVNTDGTILFPYDALSVDIHAITLTVTDEIGANCLTSIVYTVGVPPQVAIDTPTNGQLYDQGENIIFSATVSDDQDQADEILLDWQLNGSTFSTQSATSTGTAVFSDNTLAFGTHNVLVTATDSDGLTNSAQIDFTINGLPSAPSVEITPTTATTTDQLTATISSPSNDPEGEMVTYTYNWLKNNVIQSSQTTATIAAAETTKGEVWTVRVTPSDGISDGETAESSLTIQNSPPVITTPTITPATNVYLDTILTCSATATDPDESVSLAYQWSTNGMVIGNGATLDLATTTVQASAVVTCTVSVTDSDGETALAQSNVSVDNRLPTVDSVALSPTTAYTADTITATTVLSDADGNQTLTATYEWHVIDFATGNDDIAQTGPDNTLDGTSAFARDDEVYVVVTPHDGLVSGLPVTSTAITIHNTPPTAPVISVVPDPAQLGQDDLTCTIDGTSTDLDGDTLQYTYEWIDPTGTQQQTTTNVSDLQDVVSASTTTAGLWTCHVTPFDGTDSGTTVTADANVEEAMPENPFLWLDASNGTSCTTDGCAVSQWNDQSSSGFVASQNTSNRQPIYRTTGINGVPALEFDGDFLQISSLSLFDTASSPLSIFVVFTSQSISTQRFLLNHGPNSCHCSCTFELGYSTGDQTSGNFGLHKGCGRATVTSGNTISTGTPMLMTTMVLASGNVPNNIQIYKDGNSVSSFNTYGGWVHAGSYSTASSPMQIGMRNDYQTGNLDAQHNGLISEIILYKRFLSTTEQQQVECYLSNKYNLQLGTCNQ